MRPRAGGFGKERPAHAREPVAAFGHPPYVEPKLAPNDAELVRAARRGDVAALGALLERHRAPLYALALSVLGDRGLAQDSVQDAFLVALRRLDDLRDPAAVGPWLRTITRNAARMRLRRNREVATGIPDRAADPDEAPGEAAIERSALRDWVWTAVDRLPEDQRVTMMLRFFSRTDSYEEIAAILGTPVGTVRSRLNAAKRRLAEALLDTAAGAYDDHTTEAQRRWRERDLVIHEMVRSGDAGEYFADLSADALIEYPALAYRTRDIAGERGKVERGLDLGVRMQLTGVVASRGITIVEAEYHNPPEHPTHCPPLHTEIRFHPRGGTLRLVLHFGNGVAAGQDARSGARTAGTTAPVAR